MPLINDQSILYCLQAICGPKAKGDWPSPVAPFSDTVILMGWTVASVQCLSVWVSLPHCSGHRLSPALIWPGHWPWTNTHSRQSQGTIGITRASWIQCQSSASSSNMSNISLIYKKNSSRMEVVTQGTHDYLYTGRLYIKVDHNATDESCYW